MSCSHKLLECNRVDLYEQVVHLVMKYPDFSGPLSWPTLDHLDVMLLKSNINIECSALTGAKCITMTWEALISG